MNIKQIRTLVEILNNSGLSVIDITEGDTKIRLEKTTAEAPIHVPVQQAGVPTAATVMPVIQGALDFNNIREVKSPMVGVFYQAPAPDAEPYVKIGDKVKKGDVLCIIEAMKLMNEITADFDGEVVDICALNGQIVEFGQTLYKLF